MIARWQVIEFMHILHIHRKDDAIFNIDMSMIHKNESYLPNFLIISSTAASDYYFFFKRKYEYMHISDQTGEKEWQFEEYVKLRYY